MSFSADPSSAEFSIQPKAFQALHIFMIMDMEIQNGGLAQFFWNCGSPYASLVPEALKELGLEDVEQIYSGFLLQNGITMEEIDGYRIRFPAFVGIYDIHPYREFDDAYMEIWSQTDLPRRILDYAQEHSEVRQGVAES